jgi:hypothetical protein
MALLHTGDRICASCGGVNGHHQSACSGGDSIEVIHAYSRQQAIDDGILVDCEQAPMGEMRRQLLKWPLAMTATAFHRYVWPIDEEANLPPGQSLEGRFWDVVWMFHAAVKGAVPARRIDPCNLLFDCYCIVADPSLWSNEALKHWEMDTGWLVNEAKLHDLQNRLGFVVSLARNARSKASLPNPQRDVALEQLESTLKRSLLAKEEALGEVKLSNAEHRWLKEHRPKEARDWNLLTNWRLETLRYLA